MKNGLTDALKARLHRPDRDAQIYTELVSIAAEDVRQTKAEHDAGTLVDVETFEDGSARLTASNSVKIENTTGTDFNEDLGEAVNPAHLVAWRVDDAVAAGVLVRSIAVRLTRRRVGGNPAFDGRFSLRIYRPLWTGFSAGHAADVWTLVKVADSRAIAASALSADTAELSFAFTPLIADVTNPPSLELDRMRVEQNPAMAAPLLDLRGARVIVVQVVAHGGSNDNYAWLNNDAGAADQTTALAGVLYHRMGTTTSEFTNQEGQHRRVVIVGAAVGMPRIVFSTASYPASGSIAFTGGGNQLDLGAAPTAELEFMVVTAVPAGTSLACEASDDGGANWSVIRDGGTPAEAVPPLADQQTYWARATFAPNAGQDATPVLFALGVRDRVRTDVSELVVAGSWESQNEEVNPLTGEVLIAEVEIGLLRHGERDYRGIERFLSENDFASVEVRTYVGHPDLARSDWLFCDLWRLDDYWLVDDQARLLLVAVTERLKGTFPAPAGQRYGYLLKAAVPAGVTAGADFTRELSESSETGGSIVVSVAAGATESSYAYTPASVPNMAPWAPGAWTIKLNVTAAHVNLFAKVRLHRMNAAGTTSHEFTEYSTEIQLNSTGVKIFSFNLVEWPLATGRDPANRLRVEYAFRNSDGGAAHSVTIETGTVNTEVVPPWVPTSAVAPVVYSSQTIRAAYQDWRDTRVALAERYRGDLPPNTVDTVNIGLLDVDGKRQLERFAFLDGGMPIPSQGKVQFRNLWKARAAVVAVFPMEEFRVTAAMPGFRARVPKFAVPYGYDGGKFLGDVQAEHVTALQTFGVSRIDNPDRRLEEATARAIENPALATEIATSVVTAMGFGMILIEGMPTIAHPELEMGDAVLVETEDLALKDPLTGLAIRGPTWCFGVVRRIRGLMRDEIGIWVRGLYDLFNTNATVSRREPFEVVLVTIMDYSARNRASVARLGFRAFPDTTVVIRYAYLDASAAVPNRDTLNQWTTYTNGDVIEFDRDPALMKVVHAYGTYQGVQGPIVSFPVEPVAQVAIGTMTPVETAGVVTWVAAELSSEIRAIRWYIRRNAASGMYPTANGLATGVLDETYLIGGGDRPIAADRGGGPSASQSGYGAGDDSSVIAVPIDYNGNPGARKSATYAYVGTPTRAPDGTIAWVLNTAGSATVPRTFDFSWGAGSMNASDDLEIYAVVDGIEYLVASETSNPTTTLTKTNVGIGFFPENGQPFHGYYFTWKLKDSGGALLSSGTFTPPEGEYLKGRFIA